MRNKKIYILIDSDGDSFYADLDRDRAFLESREVGAGTVQEVSCGGLSDLQAGFDMAQDKINKLQSALTEIRDHKGCIAVIRRIASKALNEVEG